MNKNIAIILVFALGIFGVIYAARFFGSQTSSRSNTEQQGTVENSNSSTTSNDLSSTSTLDEYRQSHLTQEQSTALIQDIHNLSQYGAPGTYSLLGDCGQSTNAEKIQVLENERKLQMVNGSYPILRTSNRYQWSQAQVDEVMSDPTVVCGVGAFFPFEVTPQYILWRSACSSGLLPTDSTGEIDPTFVQCLQAQEVLSREYHLQD